MTNNNAQSQPTWVTNVYTPEGQNRPDYNAPVTSTKRNDSEPRFNTVAEIVSHYNNKHRELDTQ